MRADRLVAIVMLLQARGAMTAPALARELEVSTRTIYRDVDALSGAGIPVYVERGAQGGIRLLEGYQTDLTGMSAGEAEALFLMGIPGPLDQLGLGPAVDGARRKLLAALPSTGRNAAETVRQLIYVDGSGWGPPEPLVYLAAITHALWEGHRIELDYVRADNEQVHRRVDPLGLVLKAGTWYLVARSGRWEATFRVDRVRGVLVGDEPVRRPDGFDLAAWWAAHLEEFSTVFERVAVRILLDPDAIGDAPKVLGESVRSRLAAATRDSPPGAAVTIDIQFGSEAEAISALLGLGDRVEVLAPSTVRAQVVDTAVRLARRYGADRPSGQRVDRLG